MSDAVYDVRERTGDSEHASVTEVCETILARAAEPRTGHPDAHLDAAMAAAVDRYREQTVGDAVRLILVDELTFRTAATELDIPPNRWGSNRNHRRENPPRLEPGRIRVTVVSRHVGADSSLRSRSRAERLTG